MPLSVYVEGSKDPSAAGVKRVASLIAARYGLGAEDLEKRLAAGRFRVKANVDAATANAFAADLEALGARCSIVEAELSGPVRSLKGIPALDSSSSSSSSSSDPASSRALTPNSARTITASAVAPRAAASTTGAGHRPASSTGGASLRPASGLAAATSVREADSSSLNPPTLRGPSGLSAATVRPPAEAANEAANEVSRGASDDAINPPTLRGLSSSTRPPAFAGLPMASRTSTLPFGGLAQRPASPSSPPPVGGSGLAAALADSGALAPAGLGALEGSSFSLATLDGQEDSPRGAGSSSGAALSGPAYLEVLDSTAGSSASLAVPDLAFDEPVGPPAPGYDSYPPRRPPTARTSTPLRPATSSDAGQLHASGRAPTTGARAATRPSAPSLSSPSSSPPARPSALDLFAPPPEAGPVPLLLAPELPRPSASALASPRSGAEGAPMMAPAIASPFVPRAGSDAATARRLRNRLRLAFAAGVLAAVILGFAPAHLIAKSRERAAFERIDNRARIAQSEISSMAEWNALDDVRTALLRQKRAAQQEIALLSILLWIGVTGAASFAWARLGLPRLDPTRGERDE